MGCRQRAEMSRNADQKDAAINNAALYDFTEFAIFLVTRKLSIRIKLRKKYEFWIKKE